MIPRTLEIYTYASLYLTRVPMVGSQLICENIKTVQRLQLSVPIWFTKTNIISLLFILSISCVFQITFEGILGYTYDNYPYVSLDSVNITEC